MLNTSPKVNWYFFEGGWGGNSTPAFVASRHISSNTRVRCTLNDTFTGLGGSLASIRSASAVNFKTCVTFVRTAPMLASLGNVPDRSESSLTLSLARSSSRA